MAFTGRHRRSWAALVAMLALALQVIVPPGFMPASTAHGLIVVCPGSVSGMDMGATGKAAPPRPRPMGRGAKACPFAGHGLAPPLAAAPILASGAIDAPRIAAAFTPDLVTGRGLAAPPPPPRGPPILL